jgi:hypothetical protein
MSLSRSIVYFSEHNIMSVLKNDFPNFLFSPKEVIYVSNIQPIKHTPLNFQISSNIPRSRVLLFHACTEMTLKFFVHLFIHVFFTSSVPFSRTFSTEHAVHKEGNIPIYLKKKSAVHLKKKSAKIQE